MWKEKMNMTNFQVYRKTLSFSVVGFLIDMIFGVGSLVGLTTAGYFIGAKVSDQNGALIGLGIGFLVGGLVSFLISAFVTNRFKAAQIAMMNKGVDEGQLPDHTFSEGLKELHGRFGKITAFFFITSAIKSIFRQIGRGVTNLGTAVGGEVGGSIGSAIDSGIQIVLGYLCDCCLGWILYRKEVNAFKAGCEGAVIFFKHGKTLIRNIGRIFGMGIVSFLLIGGALFGGIYLIFLQFPGLFDQLVVEIAKISEEVPPFLTNPNNIMLFLAGIGAIVIWSMLHTLLIRPFILVGVLRNFLAAGKANIPSEADMGELEKISPRFSKLHSKY